MQMGRQMYEDERNEPQQNRASETLFNGSNNDTLAYLQMEMDSILEQIEHMLRGDRLKFVEGNRVWVETTDNDDKILNEKGIAEVLRILNSYLNRNTILSNYDVDTINYKVYDLTIDLSDLLKMKADIFGMDTADKKKHYIMMCDQIRDMVHSTYLRAKDGEERRTYREMISINNSTNQQTGFYPGQAGGGQERSIMNPARYILGKYKQAGQ